MAGQNPELNAGKFVQAVRTFSDSGSEEHGFTVSWRYLLVEAMGFFGEERGSGDLWQKRRDFGFLETGLRIGVAVTPLRFDGVDLFDILHVDIVPSGL